MILGIVMMQQLRAQNGADTALVNEVYAAVDKVSDPNRQIGNINPDSLPTLPIGLVKVINGTKYIIAIDSAEFLPTGAFFSAYMAIELPGTGERIAFAAKHIQFNPEGVMGGMQSRLQLVSSHYIDMGPKTELFLPGDGSNFVEWDCNGFVGASLNGAFRFNQGMLIPAANVGSENPDTTAKVEATFQVYANDLNNMLFGVSITPFAVRGMNDFIFTINEAYADMSDTFNAPMMQFPVGYIGDHGPTWRGFSLKQLSVQLPKQFDQSGNPTTIYANNMLIDDSGISGIFGATNVFATGDSEMSGWAYSLSNINVQIISNELTGGQISGLIEVPPLDNNQLQYTAILSKQSNENLKYTFAVSPDDDVSMNMFKSDLDIYQSSVLSVMVVNNTFKPQLKLNGKLTLAEQAFKLKDIAFQDLVLVTEAPYVTNGIFSLNSSQSNAANPSQDNKVSHFPISISKIEIGMHANRVVLGANIGLNFSVGVNTLTAGCSVRAKSKVNANDTNPDYSFDKVEVNQIDFELNTAAFYLKGYIDFHRDDPTYGDGFYGAMQMSVKNVLPDTMLLQAAFGSLPTYRYFMVDAAVPVHIPLGAVTLTSIRGGVSNHMTPNKTTAQVLNELASNQPNNGQPQIYVPDPAAGLAFKAGVGFKNTAAEATLNGDVLFEIVFNSNGGLQTITLGGIAYSMVKRNERANAAKYFKGAITILYDNQAKILDATFNAEAKFSDAVTGGVQAQLYFSPGLWFIKIGTPSNPGYLNIKNLAYANAYFMMGQNLPPMPPPPAEVTNIFNNAGLGSGRNSSEIAGGNGVAVGMNFNVSFNGSVGWENFSVYGMGSAGAGFDLTAYNYGPGAHCAGSNEPIGLNSWYLNGQLYAYFMLNIGITGQFLGNTFDINLINGNAALLLQGKLPKPTFVYGAAALNATILNTFTVNMNFDFEFGNNCTIIQ